MSSKEKKPFYQRVRDYDSLTVGIMFPVSIGVGLGIGFLLDRWLHTSPWMMVVFLFYGIAAGFYNLYKVYRKNGDPK